MLQGIASRQICANSCARPDKININNNIAAPWCQYRVNLSIGTHYYIFTVPTLVLIQMHASKTIQTVWALIEATMIEDVLATFENQRKQKCIALPQADFASAPA